MTGTRNGSGGGFKAVVQSVVPIAVAVILPGVGFLASQVIENGKNIARLDERTRQQTTQDEAIRRELTEIKHQLYELSKR